METDILGQHQWKYETEVRSKSDESKNPQIRTNLKTYKHINAKQGSKEYDIKIGKWKVSFLNQGYRYYIQN